VILQRVFLLMVSVSVAMGMACSAAKVSRTDLEALKPGNVVIFRYDKDGKTWRYAEKISRIEGDKIYYFPSKYEGASGKDYKINSDFSDKEMSRTKEEYYKFETDQGPERRAIMYIE
jgi:hypothetical protein